LLAAFAAGVAYAHPSLLRSDPPANAALAESPATVTVWFDEAIEPDYGLVAVYNAQGQRVDNLNTQYIPGDEPALTATLPPLPHGSYIVTWRVISTVDGHAVGGAFAFGVGVPPDTAAASAANAQANVEPDLTTNLIRFLGLAGQAIFVGALAFRLLIWLPALGALGAELPTVRAEQKRWLTVLADGLVGALIVGALGAMYVQARVTDVYFWELFGTRWGVIWLVRLGVTLTAAAMMEGLLLAESPRRGLLGLGLGAVMVLTTTLTSHSAARPGLVGPLADFAHLASTAVWAGGLVMLTLTLVSVRVLSPETRRRLTSEIVTRFSGLAAASAGLIVASGLALSNVHVPSWAGLLLTPYGQTLLVKLLLVAVAFGFGVYNSLLARRTFSIALEATVVAVVIFAAAVLADLAPASAVAIGDESVLELSAPLGELTLNGNVRPAKLGRNVFTFTATRTGEAVRALKIDLTFEPIGGGATVAKLALTESADGVYTVAGAPFQRAGAWQIFVTLTDAEGGAHYAPFNVDIGPDGVMRLAGQAAPLSVRAVGWLNQHGNAALTGLLLLLVAGWGWTAWRVFPDRRAGAVWWLLAGLLLAALIWFLIGIR
jgi:copper transport protein